MNRRDSLRNMIAAAYTLAITGTCPRTRADDPPARPGLAPVAKDGTGAPAREVLRLRIVKEHVAQGTTFDVSVA